jgi:DNA processing protein
VSFIVPKRLERGEIPHRVFDLPKPPRQLYVVGSIPQAPAVAVVGTRQPTEDAVAYASALVESLGKSGLAIWSGGALGIDAAAHRAALRVGAPTVVVAPAGWERPYPPEHAGLYREIVERGGAHISIVPAERSAQLHQFFARNALLVALVQVVVIVQAGLRSGARNTAKFARKLGRPLFAVPSSPWIREGIGCNAEISLGARVLGSPKEVLKAISGFGLCSASTVAEDAKHAESFSHHEFVGEIGSERGGPAPGHSVVSHACSRKKRASAGDTELDAELHAVLDAVRAGARNVDALCQLMGLGVSVVQSDVLRLTMLGRLRTDRTGAIEFINVE